MKFAVIPSARNLVLTFKSWGVSDIVISPGSRNAPLILSFNGDAYFSCYSIVDERSAAFFAMGLAQNQRRPVAVVCTSGSALLNYYPAVAEAFFSCLPLIVVSADRPSYKINIGDGQTISQTNVFADHIGYSANLKQDVSHASSVIKRFAPNLLLESQDEVDAFNAVETKKALNTAFINSLPVHINIPFEEPLYATMAFSGELPKKEASVEKGSNRINYSAVLKPIWDNAQRKLVLVGVNHPNEIDEEVLELLAKDPTVLVFTETTSNLHHPSFFPSIDSILFPIEKSVHQKKLFEELRPTILLTLGGLVVSKKIKVFLRDYRSKHHWHVDEKRALDTFFSLTEHVQEHPNRFLKKLLDSNSPKSSDYFSKWNAVKIKYESRREVFFENSPFSDYKAFGLIQNSIPKKAQLHLSNSSAVRYSQLFNIDASVQVFCNRGTSGIDGSTSTAIGAALKHDFPTILITGDLSFFYDSNALWNNYLRNDFRIVLINNSGGGIFRILPGNDASETFETYFETKQDVTAFHLCQQFSIEYAAVRSTKALVGGLEEFYQESTKPKLLEVITPRTENDKILRSYFDFIS